MPEGSRQIACGVCHGKRFDCPACGGNAFGETLGVRTVAPSAADGVREPQVGDRIVFRAAEILIRDWYGTIEKIDGERTNLGRPVSYFARADGAPEGLWWSRGSFELLGRAEPATTEELREAFYLGGITADEYVERVHEMRKRKREGIGDA